MKLTDNTVLITGGSSGIGLFLAKLLVAKGNTVIVCGKSNDKLLAAQREEPKLITYVCDLSESRSCEAFAKWLTQNYPGLNMLINNAAVANRIDFIDHPDALTLAENEFQTNLIAPIRLIKSLFPVLSKQASPSIINVTTGLIYAPRMIYPFYNSSKAALHSFTQTLRLSLANTRVRVIEVMFPAVDTPWHKGTPPKIAIPVERAVAEFIRGLEKDKPEIRVGGSKFLYLLSRIAPAFTLRKINAVQ